MSDALRMNSNSRSGRRIVVAAVISSVCFARAAQADTIDRRGAEGQLQGQIKAMDDGGITITSDAGGSITLSWDRVRDVHGNSNDSRFEHFRPLATELWRARSKAIASRCLRTVFSAQRQVRQRRASRTGGRCAAIGAAARCTPRVWKPSCGTLRVMTCGARRRGVGGHRSGW